MLDVHPPHGQTHTWRDFFLHIATIVVGLIIAVGLEQGVEAIHLSRERHQLEEDLRAEAERRVPLIDRNFGRYISLANWYNDVLKAARSSPVSNGFITFVVPPLAASPVPARPADSVWGAARASGLVAVLPHRDIEVWGRVDYFAELDAKYHEEITNANESVGAVSGRLGVRLAPGETLCLTLADRDELMRSVATLEQKYGVFNDNSAGWQGASDAAAHGARTNDEMTAYIVKARAAVSKRKAEDAASQ